VYPYAVSTSYSVGAPVYFSGNPYVPLVQGPPVGVAGPTTYHYQDPHTGSTFVVER
jgi:hypothetical protein